MLTVILCANGESAEQVKFHDEEKMASYSRHLVTLLLIPTYIAVSELAFRNVLNMSPRTNQKGHYQNPLM